MRGDIGHVYLLSNPALGGIVKIGHTKKVDAQLRADELSASTSIPLPFVVECSWLVEHPSACEARIHRRPEFCRVSKCREFFRIAPDEATANINFLIYGTDDASESLLCQITSLVALYRKYPESFQKADGLMAKIEHVLRGELPS